MDKVIDGIDVSGCKHYRAEIETKMPYGEYEIQKDKCHYSGIEIIQNCKGNKGCIYKQLKRLQAENEKLKIDIGIYKRIIDADKEENERLKQEVEDLNFYIDSYRQIWEVEKYRQALQEIREIADIIANTNCYPVKEAQKIIDKINSVIGAEE